MSAEPSVWYGRGRSRQVQLLLLVVCLLYPLQFVAASPAKMEVFVAIPPQKWLCEQLGADLLQIHLLLPPGQEPHSFSPSPRQIQALSGARLLFTVGLPFEQELLRRLQGAAGGLRVVQSSKEIERIPLSGGPHDAHQSLDPHVWLSPPNLKSMATVMAVALGEADPANKDLYDAHLGDLKDRLDALDEAMSQELASVRGSTILVYHPAFGYFARRYHLRQVAVETGGKSPSPRQLFSLIAKARAAGIKVIFVQAQFDPRSAVKIAEAIGGRVIPLDPLAENVPLNMRQMAKQIAVALSERVQ